MSISIRSATLNDIDWILGELKKFADFYDSKKSLYGDESQSKIALSNLIDQHIFLIADKESVGPIGFIAGLISPHLFNQAIKTLSELFWWVTESERLSRAGSMLIDEFLAWGKANADWIFFSLEQNSPVDEKCLLKRGLRLQEKQYLMEVC